MKHGKLILVTSLLLAFALPAALAAAQEASQQPSREDQASAVGCLRTINTSETAYAGTYKAGYSPTLAALSVPATGTDYNASAAGLIDESLGSGKRNGYVFTYTPGKPDAKGHITNYTVSVRPIKWEKGVQSFFTDQTGVIRGTRENRAPTAKDPAL